MNPPGHLLLLFLPLLYILIWYVTLRCIAALSGWTRLAALYPGGERPDGERVRMSWLKVAWIDYNGCVSYVANAEGLYIALWPVFNLGHAPLFVPWTEMRVEKVRQQFLLGEVVKIAVGTPRVSELQLPKRVFDAGQRMIDDGASTGVAEAEHANGDADENQR